MPMTPRGRKLQSFLAALQTATGEHVFNPWVDHDPTTDLSRTATTSRLARLTSHLSTDARYVLIGEAAGYRAARFPAFLSPVNGSFSKRGFRASVRMLRA